MRNEKLKVVLFGKTGTGKSKVMNARLGGEILPSGYGHAATSAALKVQPWKELESLLRTPADTKKSRAW